MFSVALTGNAAAGKSSVLTLFEEWGATVIDTDRLAREAVLPGSDALTAVFERFGRDLRLPDGSLDRAALRRRVMADDEQRAVLNAIVHPEVMRRARQGAEEARDRGDLILVLDIPLLFEVLNPKEFDLVILVDAPEPVCRERLSRDRGFSREEADDLLGAQLPSRLKRDRSDVVIDNHGSRQALSVRAREVWRQLRVAAARHALGDQTPQSLLAVFARPDDEVFGPGTTLARYADAGLAVHIVCATGGEAAADPGGAPDEALRRRRESELVQACLVLGVRSLELLRYRDGGPRAEAGATARIAAAIGRTRPDAIITFGPERVAGHPDHAAVHHWTRGAWEATGGRCPLYYACVAEQLAGRLPGRFVAGRPEREIAARLDTRPWYDVRVAAIRCHASQRHPAQLDEPGFQDLAMRECFAREGFAAGSGPPATDLFFA